MAFLSGLTANGLLETLARMARSGAGGGGGAPPMNAAMAPRGGSGILDNLLATMNPDRLAMAQALLAGDHKAVSRMTAPMRAQRLARQAELERERGEPGAYHGGGPSEEPLSFDPGHAFVDPGVAATIGYARPNANGRELEPAMAAPADPRYHLAGLQQDSFGWPDPEDFLPPRGNVSPAQNLPNRSAPTRRSVPPLSREDQARARRKGVNGYGYIPAKADDITLARAVFAEGQNTPEDMEAIAYAIVNRIRPHASPRPRGRANPELGSTLEEVLRARGQYSFMPEGGAGPNGSPAWRLSAAPERMNGRERASWNTAVKAVNMALSGIKPDPTEHASFFFASPRCDGTSRTAPGDYQRMLEQSILLPSPYRTPIRPRPDDRRQPWPNYFFWHRDDRPAKR